MKVTVKLYALLGQYLPPGSQGNETLLEVPDGATVAGVVARLNLPPQHCHLVLVNGAYVEPGARDTATLADGDALAIWPPIAGG
jgi:sulfur carrier protein ThiS